MKFVENEHIELKRSTGELKEAIISIAAILNKHGEGELYFGIKNDGTVVGQDVTEKTLRDVSQAIGHHIEPKIFPVIEKVNFEGLDTIRVHFKGSDMPYFAYGRVYLRVADEDKQLSPAEVEKMILEKNIYRSKWDSNLSDHTLNEINREAVTKFIEQLKVAGRSPELSEDSEVVLEKLGLIKKKKLTFAAWHLFCDAQPVELQLAVFKGNDKTGFLDFKPPVKGNLFSLLETSVEYLLDKINWRVEFGRDMKRHEIPEIPVAALREAIVNSFAHRNFNDPKSNEIAIFKDRIEIFNPGTFPPGLTPDDFITKHERSHLRNPKIAEMFYYTKNIDRWGSGLQRIDNECKENNIRYGFDVLHNGVLVTFYRPVSDTETGGIKGGIKGGMKVSIMKGSVLNLPEKQKEVLFMIMDDNSISITTVAKVLGINRSAAQKHFDALSNKGIIKRIGGKRGGHWEITNETEE
jgi:ATP-dependent DNA helicase RecG